MNSYTITEELVGQRLDQALATLLGQTRSATHHLIAKDLVRDEKNRPLKASHKMKTGEIVTVLEPTPEEEPDSSGSGAAGLEVNIEVQRLYEDGDILVINKLAGQVVHPAVGQKEGTVAQALIKYDPTIAEARYDDTEVYRARAGIVHRLDKDTSGVLLIAKSKEALLNIQTQFKERQVKKEYQAVVYGEMKPVVVEEPVGRNPRRRFLRAVTSSGKPAQTTFHVNKTGQLGEFAVSHVSCEPATGRTHQIRVHAHWLQHPILGDSLYATKHSRQATRELEIKNLLLHAVSLTILHPLTNEIHTFTAPLPTYLSTVIDRIK